MRAVRHVPQPPAGLARAPPPALPPPYAHPWLPPTPRPPAPHRSLSDIAQQAGLGGPAEAELAVLRMIDAEEVSARIRCVPVPVKQAQGTWRWGRERAAPLLTASEAAPAGPPPPSPAPRAPPAGCCSERDGMVHFLDAGEDAHHTGESLPARALPLPPAPLAGVHCWPGLGLHVAPSLPHALASQPTTLAVSTSTTHLAPQRR